MNMNRFLFRGKMIRENGKDWVFGSLNIIDEDKYAIMKPDSLNQYLIIPATLGQCTGLRDKNGKLIYEGDIVMYTHEIGESNTTEVYYDENLFEWRLRNTMLPFGIFANTDIEIIGNIHNTPDLSRGGESQ